ncbi:hypothetical protein HELRODRAFT_169139 [Helobdella robusta]|uniref:Uncharacterized protein n=1 Tax=Helobdella robusta TaxID=6412 RepID=T1F1G3_HELRO|nr:hypothetical protein HELRODRAFT_169139 [Helobdella robusta]ESO08329.1 hypothetical protein HELRODRAFT_169139 [Helobdella robusta]
MSVELSKVWISNDLTPEQRSELKKLVPDAKSKKNQRQFFIQSQRSCGKMADCEVQKLTDEGVVDRRASRRMIHVTAQKLTMKNYNNLKIGLGLFNIRSIMSKYEMGRQMSLLFDARCPLVISLYITLDLTIYIMAAVYFKKEIIYKPVE